MNAHALEPRLPLLPTLDFPRPPGRPARVGALLAVITTLSAVDLYMTLGEMSTRGLVEGNPIVVWLVETTNSPAALVLFKAISVAICVSLLYIARQRASAEVAAWLAALVLIVLTVEWVRYMAFMAELPGPIIEAMCEQGCIRFAQR